MSKFFMSNEIKIMNLPKCTAMALVILLLFSAFVGLVYAAGNQAVGSSMPGMPDNSLQYNRTDMTPLRQMEQVNTREMYVFNYRNVTLLFNSTRNCQLNVTVDPEMTPKIFSLSIEQNQTMVLTMNMTGFPSSEEMVRERTLNFYLGLEPNATLQLTAQMRLYINNTELNRELNRDVNVSRLTWMYWNQTGLGWVSVPSDIDQNNYLVCNTTHFSIWTIAEVYDSSLPSPSISPVTSSPVPSITAPTPSASPSPLSTLEAELNGNTDNSFEYLYIGILVAIVIAVAVGLYSYTKHKQRT